MRWLARRRGVPITPAEIAETDPAFRAALDQYRRINPAGVEAILRELRGLSELTERRR